MRLGDVLAVALVCGVVTAPIVLADFGVAPVYTVPANALAEPAMPLVLGLGLLAAVVDPVAPGAAAAFAWLAGWAASWIELVARVFASLPGAQVGPRGALVVLLLVVMAWAVIRHDRPRH
jgi:competence protein ComEC